MTQIKNIGRYFCRPYCQGRRQCAGTVCGSIPPSVVCPGSPIRGWEQACKDISRRPPKHRPGTRHRGVRVRNIVPQAPHSLDELSPSLDSLVPSPRCPICDRSGSMISGVFRPSSARPRPRHQPGDSALPTRHQVQSRICGGRGRMSALVRGIAGRELVYRMVRRRPTAMGARRIPD